MTKRKRIILGIIAEILRFGPTAGVVAYYSRDFFEGSTYKISAGLIFLVILILLRIRGLVKKFLELPGGAGLALFMAVFSGVCLLIGEQIFYVSITYLASVAAALPLDALVGLPREDSNLVDLKKLLEAVKK